MGYEAQIAGVVDRYSRNPAYERVIAAVKRRSVEEVRERRAAAVAGLRQIADLGFVNGGGTGSIESTVADASVTEVTSGSGLFGGHLFDRYRTFRPAPAASFVLSVVRVPAPGVATAEGGGWIASGPIGPDRRPLPVWPAGAGVRAARAGRRGADAAARRCPAGRRPGRAAAREVGRGVGAARPLRARARRRARGGVAAPTAARGGPSRERRAPGPTGAGRAVRRPRASSARAPRRRSRRCCCGRAGRGCGCGPSAPRTASRPSPGPTACCSRRTASRGARRGPREGPHHRRRRHDDRGRRPASPPRLGLALPNLGDIDRQTIAGADRHRHARHGRRVRPIAAQVVGLQLGHAGGEVLEIGERRPAAARRAGVARCARRRDGA